MEELPDEMALVVLSHIEPLRDTAAVSGTCRRWRRLMLDPHLWSLFHRRTFPSHLTTTASTASTGGDTSRSDDEEAETSSGGGAAESGTNWRSSFAIRARQLKLALNDSVTVKLARQAGYDARLLAAARVGCLPLAERALDDLFESHGIAAVIHLAFSGDRSLIDECLYRSCQVGSAPMAQLFLGLSVYEHGWSHRLAAVQTGNRQLVRLLWDAKVRANDRYYSWDSSVLDAAAVKGDAEMVRLLLDRGVQASGARAISHAARSGNVECVKLLIDRGFCPPPSPTRVTSSFMFGRAYASESDVVASGVLSGNADVVRLMFDQKYTPTCNHMLLALQQDKSPSTDMMQLLISALEESSWYACLTSPAMCRGDVAVCRFLIEHGGVDINVVGGIEGKTALHHAVLSDCLKLTQCLLACGARLDVRAPGLGVTVAGLARQYDTPSARLVKEHLAESKRRGGGGSGGKRKRKSSSATTPDDQEKTKKTAKDQASEPQESKGDTDGDGEAGNKPKKKPKKEPAAEKVEERELEVEVRRLAKLDDKAKLDLFTLRRMLRARGVLAGDMPTRKLALLQLAVDWLRAGN